MTDHNPLVWLNRNVSSNPRLMRWALALHPYNFRIVHRSGDGRRALVGENLGRALKKRDLDGGGPRLGWKERRDPKRQWRWRTRDHERRWRWRARIQCLERFVLSDKGLI
ncbi:hypothetical protein TNCV_4619621 [Trichonephila clavipes]|nr:hypothetical protein TNCV_4619621 [Trichonephila clavipes]